MKKVLALLFVASVFALASCGEKTAESSVDSTATDTTATAPAAAPADSASVDTGAAAADTTKPAAH